jgi:hypothetical protein
VFLPAQQRGGGSHTVLVGTARATRDSAVPPRTARASASSAALHDLKTRRRLGAAAKPRGGFRADGHDEGPGR